MGQNTVFEQVIKHISRSKFESLVNKHNGDFRVRSLNCWTWFGAMLFGQLSGHDSVRAIERVFCHTNTRVRKLGFSSVHRSTLADANQVRPLGILEEFFEHMVKQVQRGIPKKQFHGIESREIFLLDSTTIHLCLSLCPWAKQKRNLAGCKLHTAIDLAGEIPDFAVITPSKVQDITVAKRWLKFKRGSTVVFDRGYYAQDWFHRLCEEGVFFVTRAKEKFKYKIEKSLPVDRTQGHLSDQIVWYKDQKTKRPKGMMRKLVFVEPDTKKKFVFVTNRFDLSFGAVCDLYKARWTVELFFKTLKQNLKIRKFLGTSAHAVKAQILVALIAYVLVQSIRTQIKAHISIPDAMAVLATLLLLREPLTRLLGQLPRQTRHPPNVQLTFNL